MKASKSFGDRLRFGNSTQAIKPEAGSAKARATDSLPAMPKSKTQDKTPVPSPPASSSLPSQATFPSNQPKRAGESVKSIPELVDPFRVLSRLRADTKKLYKESVLDLFLTIFTTSISSAPCVDIDYRILAGEHRMRAYRLLWVGKKQRKDLWTQFFGVEPSDEEAQTLNTVPDNYLASIYPDGIPVLRYNFKSETHPELALEIEVGENEKRKNYTREEIRGIILRLLDAGYTYTPGRPKKGERLLSAALERIIKTSRRHTRRIIAEMFGSENSPNESQQMIAALKSGTKSLNHIREIAESSKTLKDETLTQEIESLVSRIEQIMSTLTSEDQK